MTTRKSKANCRQWITGTKSCRDLGSDKLMNRVLVGFTNCELTLSFLSRLLTRLFGQFLSQIFPGLEIYDLHKFQLDTPERYLDMNFLPNDTIKQIKCRSI